MATQKPISTISYNTKDFLQEKMKIYVKAHIIQSYMFICHKGEDGDKDHIHLRIVPNKAIDPMNLTEDLKQYVNGEEKPRGVRPWQQSKEEDWILYAVHDKKYLASKKGLDYKEKLPYEWNDIIGNDADDVERAFMRAKASFEHNSASLLNEIQKGTRASELISKGANPFLVNQLARAVQISDYGHLRQMYNDLQNYVEKLEECIRLQGFKILFDEDANPYLENLDLPF